VGITALRMIWVREKLSMISIELKFLQELQQLGQETSNRRAAPELRSR
jgi:hypothetical protein